MKTMLILAAFVFGITKPFFSCSPSCSDAYYFSKRDTAEWDSLCTSLCGNYVNGVRITFLSRSAADVDAYKFAYPDAEFVGCVDYSKDTIYTLNRHGDTVLVWRPDGETSNKLKYK